MDRKEIKTVVEGDKKHYYWYMKTDKGRVHFGHSVYPLADDIEKSIPKLERTMSWPDECIPEVKQILNDNYPAAD